MLKKIILILAINLVFIALGWSLHVKWLEPVGMLGTGLLIVVPHVLRMQRCLTQLPCPACSEKVGGYFSLNCRYHLKCRHCGQVTPTDCSSLAGDPSKI